MDRLKKEEGFSLIEALIAIVILGVGLLAVAGMQTTAMSGNVVSRDATIAVQLAEEIVDRIRVNGGNNPGIYNDLDTSGSCSSFPEPAKGDCIQWQSRLSDSNLPDITGMVAIATETPIANTSIITVTLAWGGGRTVVFTTILETWGT